MELFFGNSTEFRETERMEKVREKPESTEFLERQKKAFGGRENEEIA